MAETAPLSLLADIEAGLRVSPFNNPEARKTTVDRALASLAELREGLRSVISRVQELAS